LQTDTSVINLNTSLIVPNKYQPRKVFDENALTSLAESVKNYGIINPILVRKKDDKYEIIAGERRFRAAKLVGLKEVPVIVKDANEQQMAELALIENIQRQGLTPIEEAKSYEEILRIGNQTQASLAEKLGKSQSAIANKIRLLSLPEEIQEALANKQISERHARSLVTVQDKDKQLELLNKIITEKLTVKETDRIINEKEITEHEIKQAISDIMKSLNIEEKDEKEDDNMNNGNFFPSFDNNAANNNASLNMMNMQSMNQAPVAPEPEIVMPTMAPNIEPVQPVMEPQLVVPTAPVEMPMMTPEVPVMAPMPEKYGPVQPIEQNLNQNPVGEMNPFGMPQDVPQAPTIESPIINDTPLFGPEAMQPTMPVEPQMVVPEVPVMAPPMVDAPLFNPNAMMPSMPELAPIEPQMVTPEPQMMGEQSFEVPVKPLPTPEVPVMVDKLTELQNFLTANGYAFKVYNNDTENCVIIELPKN